MTKKDQRRIIRELCNNLKASMRVDSGRIPENWDGIELRQWLADRVQENVNYRRMDGARLRDYKNDCLSLNL